MVTECIRGDHHPLGRSREGLPTVLCSEHIGMATALEGRIEDALVIVDHLTPVVTWSDDQVSFSHGSGVGVG